jgi:hypothetical protein
VGRLLDRRSRREAGRHVALDELLIASHVVFSSGGEGGTASSEGEAVS